MENINTIIILKLIINFRDQVKHAKTNADLQDVIQAIMETRIDLDPILHDPDNPDIFSFLTQTDSTDIQDIDSITDGISDNYDDVIDTYGHIEPRIDKINQCTVSLVVRTHDEDIVYLPEDDGYLEITKEKLITTLNDLINTIQSMYKIKEMR